MAEKTYYNGIPDIPADAETKVITEPYKLDPNAKYESDKFLTGEETRRRALVTGSWKLDTGALQYDLPKPLEVTRSIGVAAEDSARHTLAQFVNEVLTSPGKTATGTAIGALTWKALTPVAENALAKTIGTRAASSLLGKIGAGVVGGAAAAGVAGAAGYAFFPTPAGDAIEGSGGSPEMFEYSMKQSHARKAQQTINQATKDFNDKKITQEELDKVTQENQPVIDEFNAVEQKKRQSDVNSVYAKLQNAKNVLEQAKQDLSEGKITQKEFDDRQEFFDRTVSSHLEYAKQLDYFNDAVKMLEGAPYPTQSIAEDIIASTSEFIQNRDFLREIQNIQKGVDPDNVLNVTASTIGRMVPIIATSAFTGRFTRLGRKQFFKSLVNDPEFKTVVFRPVKSAKQAAAAAEKAGLIGTYMQELGDIAWEEKQKYIEETGDVDLINYVPSDDLSKYAYSAAAAQIEFMGGVEPLFAGGLRRALRTGGVRTALKAGALTGAEEIAEEMEQGFSRFLTQKMSGTTDKTWGEGLKEILISMAYAGPIGFGFGSAVHAYGRRQLIKGLTEYGLSPETAAKVADNMIDQVETANNPQLETVRDNLRSKIAVLYEDKDLSEAEKEDAIETQTDLEMSWLVTEAAEKGYAPEESPLLQGVVNEIGYFRTGIPEQITDDVARLNNEIADLRQQLRDENAKEQKDFNKIEELESKIEQFYAKLPQDIANIVETDRVKVRQMLSEQSERAMDISNRRKIASQVRQRALRAMQKQDESELQQSLRRLQEQTRKEESETRAEERKQRTEQRKLRRAIEKMRQNVLKRKERMLAFQEMFADPDLVYKALRDSGFTDEQIATMPQDDIVKAVLPYGISPQILKQSDLAAENARLDDIYPAYDGETIEVDGKERTVYNSNGDRIAKSKEALTNFWRWFGDSKVVDEQGRPLVVYHGSDVSGIEVFDNQANQTKQRQIGAEKGYFFTDSKKVAERFRTTEQRKAESKYYAENTIREPVTEEKYDAQGRYLGSVHYTKTTLPESKNFGLYPVYLKAESVNEYSGEDIGVGEERATALESAKQSGKDGVIIYKADTGAGIADEYIVFDSTQIKSVDNRGTYSADTGNILYQHTILSDPTKTYKVKTERQNAESWLKKQDLMMKTAKEFFGTTTDWREAGYILPDGSLLDLSGANYGGTHDGTRKLDHRDIRDAFERYEGTKEFPEGVSMDDFINAGAIRFGPEAMSFMMAQKPTSKQLAQIDNLLQKNSEQPWNKIQEPNIELMSDAAEWMNRDYSYYNSWKPEQADIKNIKKLINAFYEGEGITPAMQNFLQQTKVSGKGKDFRGFYVPDYRLIVLSPDADVTTLTHEFAHDWLQQFFRHYRSGKASESFMKSWGAVEKALGISPDAITVPDEASEAFSRAYEGWVLNKKDWAKNIDVDDENREQLIERFKRYQEYLTDIYEDLTNPYFKNTWGKVGELKPELQAWFEQVTMADDVISAKVASGAITPEQAQIRTISKNVNDVVQAAEDNFTQKEKDEINAVERLNDTSRYEVPGGNKNSLQNRLSGLARDIDANNVALGRYETHRDMLEVAKAADEFVRTRTDEALNIINGIEPEKEGLYASDLYTALERVATETNNVDLAMELINSKVAQDLAKEWGQRVAGFRNFTGDGDFDTISQLKSLDNQYKKDYNEKEKQKVNTAADEYVTELNNADDAQDVDAFLDSIKCQ